ncbi:NADH dehydrogenase [ubiquinone] 1 alpha subcomplex assembly factor 3 [Protopterus annectens]|uniref:NADH dehydrogenase [ubiquinone] 1 alpha subcomplex assembly factor 3 n=1 Tax=Protopterus annectens TaxID=7888 RepID=UPI001CFC2781|nr:NADH dehydrogenase [ubiquinone] 1 alpha subcomplex assembly factor 3 [Protopterus annectens]
MAAFLVGRYSVRCLQVAATRASAFRQPFRGHRLVPGDDELYQKTMVTVMERDGPDVVFIDGYSTHGFTVNGDRIIGPCAIVPQAILQWNVGSSKDVSVESLALFHLLEPKIEILVLGTGDRAERIDPQVLKFMRRKGIAVEVQDTPNACATFNFLTSERRITAAALIPPSRVGSAYE